MPELPEVETIRTDLEAQIQGKKIQEVLILRAEYIKEGKEKFQEIVTGNIIKTFSRVGKLVMAELSSSFFLLFHLGMTGRLIFDADKDSWSGGYSFSKQEFPQHTHLVFIFEDNTKLRIQDVRRFGYVKLVNTDQLQKILSSYGKDAWKDSFTGVELQALMSTHKATIKSLLLQQDKLAGLGNIYVDEICFASKIKPTRAGNTLTRKECEEMVIQMKRILQTAIAKRGTSFRDYVDAKGKKGNFVSELFVYGRGKEHCLLCKTPLTQQLIAQRTTVFCHNCQK